MDSLRRRYSVLMATAMARASSLHGDHSLQLRVSFEEWNRTGRSSLFLMAYNVWPIPSEFCAASVLITNDRWDEEGRWSERFVYGFWLL